MRIHGIFATLGFCALFGAASTGRAELYLRNLATEISGTASANSTATGRSPEYAFNGDRFDTGWGVTSSGSSRTLTFAFNSEQAVNAYRITAPSAIANGANSAYGAPKGWTLSGSNDNKTWETLDTRTDETDWRLFESRLFRFENTTPYQYYRLSMSASNAAGVNIAELEYFTIPESGLIVTASGYEVAGGNWLLPTYGVHEITASEMTCTASGGTFGAAKGWKLYLCDPESWEETLLSQGSGSSAVLSELDAENLYKLVWEWDYSITFQSADDTMGSVSTDGGVVAANSTVTCEAIPEEGYAFVKWGGTVPEDLRYRNPLTFAADKPRAITAIFGSVVNVGPSRTLTTIQAGINAASEGQVVLVDAGTYTITAPIALNKAVTVRSKEGRENTIIDRSGSVRHINITAADAVFDGFTLKNLYCYNGLANAGVVASAGVMRDCIITNASTLYRAPICYFSGTSRIEDSLITGIANGNPNSAGFSTTPPLGLRLENSAVADRCVIKNLKWANGSYTQDAAAVGIFNAAAAIRNSLIVGNENGDHIYSSCVGAAILLDTYGGRVENCTIADNITWGSSPAARVNVTRGCYFVNCIFKNNTITPEVLVGNGFINDFNGATLVNCCLDGSGFNFVGKDNFTADPRFVDSANGDYRLSAATACRDAGFATTTGADLVGAPRVKNGAIDVGCFECEAIDDALECAADVTTSLAAVGSEIDFSAVLAGASSDAEITWNFGDGTSGEGAVAKHGYTTPGRYTVVMTVTDGGQTKSANTEVVVKGDIAYVSLDGTAEFPYDTPAKATPNLDNALALQPAKVMIGEGTFTLGKTSRIIEWPVEICGAGPDKTILDANGKRHFEIKHPGAKLAGVKLTKASAPTQNEVASLIASAGIITNCVWNDVKMANRNSVVHLSGTAIASNCVFGGVDFGYNTSNSNNDNAHLIRITDSAMLTHSIITNNLCDTPWQDKKYAVVSVESANAVLRNCLIADNSLTGNKVAHGAGVICKASGTVENCTIVNNKNTCGGNTAGILITAGTPKIRNCIISGNSCNDGIIPQQFTAKASAYTFCASLDLETDLEKGNISTAGTLGEGYRPEFSSAVIDAGQNQEWMAQATDLDNHARIIDAKGSETVDIGAFEYLPSGSETVAVAFDPTSVITRKNTDVLFTANISGASTYSLLWDFGDGTTADGDRDQKTAIHAYDNPGAYKVTLTANVGGEEYSTEVETCVIVVPETCFVSLTGSNETPFLTPETAANTLQDAIALAPDEIIVLEGTYLQPSQGITVNAPIKIRSEAGPEKTIIESSTTGEEQGRLISLLNGGALVSGFTLKNGKADMMSEPIIKIDGGTIDNCVITNIRKIVRNDVLTLTGGVVTNCVFDLAMKNTMNTSDTHYNHVCGVYASDGLVVNCEFKNFNRKYNDILQYDQTRIFAPLGLNGANAIARGCLIYCNTNDTPAFATDGFLPRAGGVVIGTDGGRLENCTIADNYGANGGGIEIRASAAKASCVNCIVYNNSSNPDAEKVGDNVSITYNGGTVEDYFFTSIVGDNPKFLRTRAKDGESPYDLRAKSPARNTATVLDWMHGASDIKGTQRIVFGAPDIGALESLHAIPTMLLLR